MEGYKEEFLLQKYVDKKIANYVEPSRLGTPKGDPIGFSKDKYSATLYMLYHLPLKAIAKNYNFSYGLLRKWRTEDSFMALFKQHCRDFASLFIERHLIARANAIAPMIDEEIRSTPIDKVGTLLPRAIVEYDTAFLELKYYSIHLIQTISDELERNLTDRNVYVISVIYVFLKSLWMLIKPGEISPTFEVPQMAYRNDLTMIYDRIRQKTIQDAQVIIGNSFIKQNPTEKERKEAMYLGCIINKVLEKR